MGHILTCTLFLLQAREISVPTSSRSAFPHALKKIAFPRARMPKMPGTRELGIANPGTRAQLWQYTYSILSSIQSFLHFFLTSPPHLLYSISFVSIPTHHFIMQFLVFRFLVSIHLSFPFLFPVSSPRYSLLPIRERANSFVSLFHSLILHNSRNPNLYLNLFFFSQEILLEAPFLHS